MPRKRKLKTPESKDEDVEIVTEAVVECGVDLTLPSSLIVNSLIDL